MNKASYYISYFLNTTLVILLFVWIVIDNDRRAVASQVEKWVHSECNTVDQAADMARLTVLNLSKLKDQKAISSFEYERRINMISLGLKMWSEREDIGGYCSAVLEANNM